MRFLLLIVLIMFAIQTQAIEADRTRLKEYELVTVTHEVGEVIQATFNFVNEDGTIERRVLGDEHFDRRETATTFTGPPGMYEITVGKPLFIEIVREGRPQPDPTPKPNPDPKPQPDPKPDPTPDPEPQPDPAKLKVSTILFVEEQQDRSINQAETLVLTNQAFRDDMKSKGVKTVIVDKDLEIGMAWKGLTDIPLPIVVFYEDSKRYKIEKVPKTVTELNALVGKVMQ